MNKDNFIGKTYGSYLLIKKLGAGAFGQIYLGKSENDEKSKAIKLEPCNAKYP
jgi:serine/threonine protein kinase